MMMMKRGTQVLEIREREDTHNNCYSNLANTMGLNYYYVLASREDPGQCVHSANLVVSPEKLITSIAQMIADRESAKCA